MVNYSKIPQLIVVVAVLVVSQNGTWSDNSEQQTSHSVSESKDTKCSTFST